jgi:hypothetical protein
MGMETLMLGALAGKMIYDKGKKSAKKKAEASSAQKQAQIDALQMQNDNLQLQMQTNRRNMFSDLGFENKKPNGTSGGMLPM